MSGRIAEKQKKDAEQQDKGKEKESDVHERDLPAGSDEEDSVPPAKSPPAKKGRSPSARPEPPAKPAAKANSPVPPVGSGGIKRPVSSRSAKSKKQAPELAAPPGEAEESSPPARVAKILESLEVGRSAKESQEEDLSKQSTVHQNMDPISPVAPISASSSSTTTTATTPSSEETGEGLSTAAAKAPRTDL